MTTDPFTPDYEIPLTRANATPAGLVRGDVYNRAMEIVDAALTGIATAPRVRGSFYVEDNVDATPSPGATGVKAVMTGAEAGPPCRLCDINGNRLTYVGDVPAVPTVIATANLQSGAQTTLELQVRRNGAKVPGASFVCRLPQGATTGFVSLAANVELEPDDFLEIWVANLTGPQDVTVLDATLATRG